MEHGELSINSREAIIDITMNKTQSTTFAKTVSQKLNNKFQNLKFKLQDGSVNPDST